MIPGRTKGSLSRFFRDQGAWWCRQVEIVVSDGSRSYQAAIAQYLPGARHVLDRFHVARWFTQGLTLVRRELQRRDPDQRPPTYEPDLFRARFTLLRRADHLTDAHQSHLDRLFDAHPRLRTAWDALQELYQLYEAEDLDGPNQALGRFADLYGHRTDTRIPTKLWTPSSPGEHKSWPTTPADEPLGPLEGINNLLQVLRRVAHGFTNYDKLRSPGNPRNMSPTPSASTAKTHDFAQPQIVRLTLNLRMYVVYVAAS